MTTTEMIVTPEVGLIDGALHVLVRNLRPRAEVTIRAFLRDDSATTWNSCATYRADDQGTVDLARYAPISGSYAGVDEDGLITSLRTAADRPGRTFDNSSLAPLLINFVVEVGGRELARAAAHRMYVGAGVAALDRPMPKASIIPVEQINGPILLISGEDDRMWPSARMGDQIVERLVTGRHRFPVVHRRYAQAGHLMRTPGVPTTTLRNRFEYGGVPSAQAAANRAAWIETIAFLRAHLGVYSTAPEPAVIGAKR